MYGIFGLTSIFLPLYDESLRKICLWVYIVVALPFAFQVIYVEITDFKEKEKEMLKDK